MIDGEKLEIACTREHITVVGVWHNDGGAGTAIECGNHKEYQLRDLVEESNDGNGFSFAEIEKVVTKHLADRYSAIRYEQFPENPHRGHFVCIDERLYRFGGANWHMVSDVE